jgi:outer membrane protein assembly factor BamA
LKRALLYIIFFALFAGACKTTKYVPEDAYLLNSVNIKSNDAELKDIEFKKYLKQKPNLKIFGLFRLNLGIYNISGENQKKWWNRWFRRIGEEPVVFDEFLMQRSTLELEKVLKNKGYYYAQVTDTVIFSEKKRKAAVTYFINPDKPFILQSHSMSIPDDDIREIIEADSSNSVIKTGEPFDLQVLDIERDRISKLLRKQGYYYFTREFINYVADSSLAPYSVSDTLFVRNPYITNALNQRVESKHRPYKIGDVFFITDFDPQKAVKQQGKMFADMDTIEFNGFYFLYNEELKIKPIIFVINNLIKPGDLYNYLNAERTHALLSSIPIIRYVNIKFEDTGNEITPTLNCYIQVTQSEQQGYTIDIEGTNQSGNLGAAVNLGYQHRNLLKGGELFVTRFRAARETQTGLSDKRAFNSDELGVETSLEYPRFLFPLLSKRISNTFKSNTNFKGSYNYQNRPDYVRYIAGLGTRYNWGNRNYWSHSFDVIDLNYVRITRITDEFKQYIDTTFLRYSYEDHVITSIGYNLVYNDQDVRKSRDSKYFRFGFESAGNTLYGINSLMDAPKTDDSYQFLGIKFSQFLKFDLEGTYNQYIDEKNTVAYHAAIGVGFPYGNLNVMPFEKRYFGGGANGIRAWQVRTLGPGTYHDNRINYMNQSGDVRLQANIEYRFKLIWVMEGALFSDVGNVWTIRNYDNQRDGVFLFDNFYKQLAMAYGIGARFDFNFFVFRLDLGIKGYDPMISSPNKWVSSPSFKNDMALHVAIGYPF